MKNVRIDDADTMGKYFYKPVVYLIYSDNKEIEVPKRLFLKGYAECIEEYRL